MGARIAAHLANAGIPCFLLDIAPRELNAGREGQGIDARASRSAESDRSRAAWKRAKKSRPAAFFTAETPQLITIGNFEDNLGWCGEVDWIIEAVAENLEIKRGLLERVEQHRKPGHDRYHEYFRIADSSRFRRALGGFRSSIGPARIFSIRRAT